MNRSHSVSASDLSASTSVAYDDSALEGVAANVKVLLKLIEDHKNACSKDQKDGKRMLRVAGMMTILEMVKSRLQKCQSFGTKKPMVVLRRCNTDLRVNNIPKEKKVSEQPADEKEKLKKQINSSLSARKSLEIMCSSIGKEKEIIAHELARKAQEVSGMEDYISDLKAQNETLLEKVQEYTAAEPEDNRNRKTMAIVESDKKPDGTVAALQMRNNELAEQLQKSCEEEMSAKRKLEEAQQENVVLQGVFEETRGKIGSILKRIREVKHRVLSETEHVNIQGEISGLEELIEFFDKMILKDMKIKEKTRN